MTSSVGTKGQIVIQKQIRDRLGIVPGSIAIQRIVGDHVEVYFLKPTTKSLAGSLAKYAKNVPPGLSWSEIRERAWTAAAEEKEAGWKQ